jgi:Kef-type K+ transport system membrane component KefB
LYLLIPYPYFAPPLFPCPAGNHFGYVPRRVIVGSYGSSIFSFSKEAPYCFLLWLYQFTYPPTVLRCSRFSISSPAFVIYVLSDDSRSNKWYLIAVLVFISLMIVDVEHLLMCQLAICMSSLGKYLFKCSAHFLSQFLYFLHIEFLWVIYIFWKLIKN